MSTEQSPEPFDEERAESYDKKIRQLAPGYDTLHRTLSCLTNRLIPVDSDVLIVGAGTGVELVELGQMQESWEFTAVDPSAAMLRRAKQRVDEAGIGDRITFVESPIEEVSIDRPFDGATSIFVSHFFSDLAARRRYFQSIGELLAPDAPLFVADLFGEPSTRRFQQSMDVWRTSLQRSGAPEKTVQEIFERIDERISFISEDHFGDVLKDAGFGTVERFYQCLRWGAWWTRRR